MHTRPPHLPHILAHTYAYCTFAAVVAFFWYELDCRSVVLLSLANRRILLRQLESLTNFPIPDTDTAKAFMPRSFRSNTRRSMSVKKMDTNQTLSVEDNLKSVLKLNECESTHLRNDSLSVRLLEDLQSLRKFEAVDGKIVTGHKIVLIAASPYFRAMFSNNFDENNKDLVFMRELDSTILQLLVDYIYTGEIIVTKENVQVLLPAANILQLDYVSGVCAEFLKKQIDTSNCLGIRAFADFHNCTELLSTSEEFITTHFLEVVKSDEYLSSSSEDVVKLISYNDIAVPFEEKVGGVNSFPLKSVEYYDPTLDTWTPVAEMTVCRVGVGVGVLDGLMYAIGGTYLKSVEVYTPSDGVWSSVADMHVSRYRPGVVSLDGLLYVMGGEESRYIIDTVEIYNPVTNTWTLETMSTNIVRVYGAVVVDKPPHYT